MAYSLTKNDVLKLNRILLDLMLQSEADGCIIFDQAGHVMAQVGVGGHDPHLLSALGAGVFSATGELAKLLGEDEFSVVLHQGTQRSIMICAASSDALLAVIFSSNASVGMVKLYAPPAAASVRSVLENEIEGRQNINRSNQQFVLNKNEDIFGVDQSQD